MKTKHIQIRLSPEERKRLIRAAGKEGISVSEFLRRAGDERANNGERDDDGNRD